MIIPTPASLRATAQRLDRRDRGVTVVLNAMRHGAALHRTSARRRPIASSRIEQGGA
jgi:hypothetical protein